MIQIRRSAIVRYKPVQMYDLVNDVAAYPRRFGWCSAAQVLAQSEGELTARLELRIAGMTQAFTTCNALAPPSRIGMRLVDGPLHHLSGVWDFVALGEQGCKVALELDFDYSGKIMAPVVRLGFQKLADRLVDEFCAEALRAYG